MTVQLAPLPSDRYDDWFATTRARLIALRHDSGSLVGEDADAAVDQFLGEMLAQGLETPTSVILTIDDDGRRLGTVWIAANNGILFLVDLAWAVAPDEGQRDGLLAALRSFAADHRVDRISIAVFSSDAEGQAFAAGRGFEVASIQMLLEPVPHRDAAPEVTVLPMTPERFTSFAAASEAAFADDLVASGRYSPEDAAVESHRQMVQELPDGIASAGQELFVAEVDGVEVGVLWLGMRTRGGRPHAFVLDIEVGAEHRRRGYGRAMMLAAEREAVRLGAESIGLHVFGFNAAAIRLYESLGYRRLEERFLFSI